MNGPEKNIETKRVACKVCLKEIPRSDARAEEVSDYVLYFCGLDCYEKWQKENGSNEE